jgi:hypothetical protein
MELSMPLEKRRIAKLALAALAGAWVAKAFLLPLLFPPYHPDRTPKMDDIPPRIEALFETTRSVCFGRFMIDVPETAQVAWGPADVPYKMITYPGEGPKLQAEIAAKIEKITSEKHNEEPSMLIGVFDSVNPESKIVVGYQSSIDAFFAQLHSYIRLGQTAFVQSIPSSGLFVTDKSNPSRSNRKHDKTAYKQDVDELQDTARRLRLRAADEAPSDHGICIEGGFISSPLDYAHERIGIGFRFPEYPDASFSVEVMSRDEPDQYATLEKSREAGRRMAEFRGMGKIYSQNKMLRMGKRRIGQWEGEEGLMRLAGHGATPSTHQFKFLMPGVGMDMLRPYVRIDLFTGVRKNDPASIPPGLEDEEVIALWDKLTSTIRVRPTRETKEGEAAEGGAKEGGAKSTPGASLPLPRLATGDPCPKAGPWRCVEDGKTLRFVEGQLMPPAVFYKPASGLLNRLRGIEREYSHNGPGHWEWVGEGNKG